MVQDAGVPLRPSISTRQRRHEPNELSESVAQSFGILVPSSIAARMIDVPSGTVMEWPSISSVTIWVAADFGVPKSVSLMRVILAPHTSPSFRRKPESRLEAIENVESLDPDFRRDDRL